MYLDLLLVVLFLVVVSGSSGEISFSKHLHNRVLTLKNYHSIIKLLLLLFIHN
nr:MAG TPA: hypothetical protein [Bacteriophage sp.]